MELKNVKNVLDAQRAEFTTQKTSLTTQKDLSATQKAVLDYFRNYPKGTRADAANAIPYLSEDGVKYHDYIQKTIQKDLLLHTKNNVPLLKTHRSFHLTFPTRQNLCSTVSN